MKSARAARWQPVIRAFDELPASTKRHSRAQRQVLVNRVANEAKAVVRDLQAGELSRDDVYIAQAVLRRAIAARREDSSLVRTLWYVILGLLAVGDTLQGSLRQVDRLISQSSTTICHEDKRFLVILTRIMSVIETRPAFSWNACKDSRRLFSDDDANFFNAYLGSLSKRQSLCETLQALVDTDDVPACGKRSEISSESYAISAALHITAKRRERVLHPDKLADIEQRLGALSDKFEMDANYRPSAAEQLTIADFSLAAKAHRMVTNLATVAEQHLLPAPLADTFAQIERIEKICVKVRGQLFPNLSASAGDIVFDNYVQSEKSHGERKLDIIERGTLKILRSPLMHAGITIQPLKVAQMWQGTFVHSDTVLEDLCFRQVFRFDWRALVDDTVHGTLQSLWGDRWENRVKERYAAHVQNLAGNQTEYAGLRMSSVRMYTSVIKPHRLFRTAMPEPLGLHEGEAFCSEIVAKLIYAALHRLENDLQIEASSLSLEDESTALAERFVRPVFSSCENFSAVHPGYLARRLSRFGEFVPLSPLAHRYISDK